MTCAFCLYEFEVQSTRRRSRLETPHRNTETLVSTTPLPGYGDVVIKKPPTYRGSFKSLSEKGIKITSYDVRDGSGKPLREEEE
jgi:hypothetical protein